MQYFFSYMGVAMLIALMVMGILYARTVAMVNEQHGKTAQDIVQAQQRVLDRVFLEIEQIALQIDSDASFSSYRLDTPGYDAYQGMLQLRRYVAANNFLRDVAILSPGGTVLSSVGTFELDGFIKRYDLPQIDKAKKDLESGPQDGSHSVQLYPVSSTGAMLVAMPQPLVGLPKNRLLVFILEKTQIDALFSAVMQGEGSDFAVVNREDGAILYRFRPLEGPMEEGGMILSRTASTRLEADYVYRYDASLENDKFVALNRSFFQIILLTLLAGFFVSQGMSAVNYRPVRRLIELLPGREQTEGLADVEAYMRGMMDRNMEMAQQLKSYSSLTHDYALQQALLGREGEARLSQLLAAADILFPHPYYTVFHFLTTDFQPAEPGEQPVSCRPLILRELCRAASRFGCAEGVEWYDASWVMVLNHPEATLDTQAVHDAVFQCAGSASILSAGCGVTVDRLSKLNHSMYEAMSFSELARFRLQPFMDAAHDRPGVKEEDSLRLPLEDQLLAAVEQGNEEGIHALVASLDQRLQTAGIDGSSLHLKTMAFISRLATLAQADQVEGFEGYVRELMGRNTLATYIQTLESFCLGVSGALCASKAMREDALLRRITSLIEERYEDPELTVHQIAQSLSMSASYLTRYMRERMQTTPSKYLEAVRMEKAEELLVETNFQIKEITCRVGYTDASSFVRKFKAETGLTPNKYRAAAVSRPVRRAPSPPGKDGGRQAPR